MPDPSGWRAESIAGLTLIRCEALLRVPGIGHAFSTRVADGGSGFDVGGPGAAGPDAVLRRERLCAAAGLTHPAPAILRQVHGDRLVRAGRYPERDQPEADGILALAGDRPRLAPAVRVADCVPILLADRRGGAVAAVHAGWRGTALEIAVRAVEALAGLGIAPDRLVAALGPAVGPCCYEVEPGVAERVAAASAVRPDAVSRPGRAGRRQLDLREALRIQLLDAGLTEGSIHVAPWCTCCRPDLFHSYRRDGPAAGRLQACIGWSDRGSA